MRVACILTDFYEDSEFEDPFRALRDAGHEVSIVGLESGQQVKGKQGKSTATDRWCLGGRSCRRCWRCCWFIVGR